MKGKGKPGKLAKALATFAEYLTAHDLEQMRILAGRAGDAEFAEVLETEGAQRSTMKQLPDHADKVEDAPKGKEPDND